MVDAFDPALFLQLPGGDYTPRRGPPCPEHGTSRWEVVRATRMVEGRPVTRDEAWCPKCAARQRRSVALLGWLDRMTGIYTPTEETR